MKAALLGALWIGAVAVGSVRAQEAVFLPEVNTLEQVATFESLRTSDIQAAFDLADDLLEQVDDIGLQLYFAHVAFDAGGTERAISYAIPAAEALEPADPRLTEALDLLVVSHEALGDPETALAYELLAYNSAEARLGPENLALMPRLLALEPKVEDLRPELLGALQAMRAAIPTEKTPKPQLRAEGGPTAVEVWFGTNRKDTGASDPAQRFGSDLDDLTLGSLTVTIPPGHLSGLIERPEGWFFSGHLDPEKHVVLASLEDLTKEAFAQGCCAQEDKLLFVHGYNVTFHDGALRAAQLAFDLEFRGKPMYYSWPSKASLYGYLADANNVVPSRPAMEEFLEIATRGAGKLHIIAHSMGNRYTLEALETFLLKHPERRIGQLVLAAPDVDRAEFEARFGSIRSRAEGVTLYASRNDLALQVSRRVNGGYRLGDASGEVFALEGLDTVDASLIEADTLGHSYFGDAPQMLGDILGLVRLGWGPQERCGVSVRDQNAASAVWEVQPDGCRVEEIRTAGDLIRLHGDAAGAEAARRLDAAGGDQMAFWQDVLAVVEDRLHAK